MLLTKFGMTRMFINPVYNENEQVCQFGQEASSVNCYMLPFCLFEMAVITFIKQRQRKC